MDFGFLKKIFRFGKKSDDDFSSDLKSLSANLPSSAYTPSSAGNFGTSGMPENVSSDNMKAKIDLVMTQLDSLKIQYESINQRLIQIESMVREIHQSSRSPTPRF